MNKVDFIRSQILPVFKKYNVKRAGIFGSVARGEDNIQSDVDILIELDDNLSLFDYIRMKLEIEEILGKSVDLVEYNAIKPSIKNKILEEEIRIL
ncbi:nucleotidyltransferase family protein [Athalassotoga saccharophila]|uniref:nucleotidyltransferase family protein n=1 Tax=Athalassotoga saccharophila TaxID=1441386 RepID=UPI00137A654C|nr:nucleotidyltransferase family protein [Athalassotoga saccharophila]BBJ27753.1 DNA polymerase beta domain protein [Athalassotoga saccharophila]